MRFAAIEKDVHTLVTIAYFNMVLIGLLALLYVVR
jgi:hypothetical protein